jgi:hypothetical protein
MRRLSGAAGVIGLALLAACSKSAPPEVPPPAPGKVTAEAAEKVRRGMTLPDVAAILGGPTELSADGAEQYATWRGSGITVVVTFEGGRARNIIATGAPGR